MPGDRSTKVIGGDMEIDLRAGDQSMTEQVADGDQSDAGAQEMSCEGMADAMRRQRNADPTALSPSANPFVDTAAREPSTKA